jgi:hypothetical protein
MGMEGVGVTADGSCRSRGDAIRTSSAPPRPTYCKCSSPTVLVLLVVVYRCCGLISGKQGRLAADSERLLRAL